MIIRLILIALFTIQSHRIACGEYLIDLRARAGGTQSHTPGYDTLKFEFSPIVALFEETSPDSFVPSSAFLTLASPTELFQGFDNHPSGFSGSGLDLESTGAVVNEVNGTWQVTIKEGENSFQYDVDVTIDLPFAELPHFTSTTLINGNPAGPFSWTLEGGSADYPGHSEQLFLAELSTLSFDELASAYLPAGTETWTPPVGLTGTEDFLGRIQTFAVAYDYGALSVVDIRPLTPGAPTLTMLTSMEYTATLAARLTPLSIPEPSASILAIAGIGTLLGFRRCQALC